MLATDVRNSLESILRRIDETHARCALQTKAPKPLLVAVSKTKPREAVIDAYKCGQRHFGENYVQELVEKSHDEMILRECPDIKWHFIGHLQVNKINKIVKVPNIYMVQTVDDERSAQKLNSAWEKIQQEKQIQDPLKVLIQVNTSGEEAKHGLTPSDGPQLFKYVHETLKSLKAEGVMTIGAFDHNYTAGPNPDFIALMEVHRKICEENAIEPDKLQVSMGMSNDFEKAIEMGSTIVRVGSSIFGAREYKKVD